MTAAGGSPPAQRTAVIALGSNLGDRRGNLEEAVAALLSGDPHGSPPLVPVVADPATLRASHIYETPPWGGIPQPAYLNAAVLFETGLEPGFLLGRLLAIEAALGRVRGEKWGPRTIDIDLLDLGGLVVHEEGLELPHPRIAERAFVLVPLCEVAPRWRHPLTGATAAEMLSALDPDPDDARLYGPLCVDPGREEKGADSGAA